MRSARPPNRSRRSSTPSPGSISTGTRDPSTRAPGWTSTARAPKHCSPPVGPTGAGARPRSSTRAGGRPSPPAAGRPTPDRARLSKRHGATSVLAYRDLGYLPDAVVNYLARLGWSHGDQELFTRAELIEHFTLENVGKAAGIFNPEKLEWVNFQYMKAMPPADLAGLVVPFLERAGLPVPADRAWLVRVVETLRERAKPLVELAAF